MNDDFVVNSQVLSFCDVNTHIPPKNFSMSKVISFLSRQCGRVIASDRIVREKLLEKEGEGDSCCKKRSKNFIASHIHAIASLLSVRRFLGDKMLRSSHVQWRWDEEEEEEVISGIMTKRLSSSPRVDKMSRFIEDMSCESSLIWPKILRRFIHHLCIEWEQLEYHAVVISDFE